MNLSPIAISCGEPAGIGPEIALRAAWQLRGQIDSVLLGDATQLALTAQALDPEIILVASSIADLRGGLPSEREASLRVIDCPLTIAAKPGQLDARNGRAVLAALDIAIDGALAGDFAALVTAPLQKSTINDAGIAFTGHTEYLAQRCGIQHVVMLLTGAAAGLAAPLRVALATIHLALKDVPAALTFDSLSRTLTVLDADLRTGFGLASPRILLTGLNPHAGESGYLGREEIDIIIPAIEAARQRGIDARGPYPADTLFQPRHLQDADCVLAMYHDQGLPVLKYASFGHGVNVTLGLPIIRTSVDHGTALDLAARGIGHADHHSMLAALRLAAQMARVATA